MLKRATLILSLVALGVLNANAQTVADFHAKYGKSVDGYSVSEHIWMTPEYAADGQVCQLRLYPKRVDAKTNSYTKSLPFDELRDVLNELVPLETRGGKKKSFGMSTTGGGFVWTTYEYENVLFTFNSHFRVSIDSTVLKRGEFVFLDADLPPSPPPRDLSPGKDDFAGSGSSNTEIVTVSWTGRKCVSQ